jgi:hypothetical protein
VGVTNVTGYKLHFLDMPKFKNPAAPAPRRERKKDWDSQVDNKSRRGAPFETTRPSLPWYSHEKAGDAEFITAPILLRHIAPWL